MSTEEFVILECITDNPYQPRTTDNTEHIENLARSIAADGLLQKPTARHGIGSTELAFGHSRRKAFEWLRANWKKAGLQERYNEYSQMPLNIEDLSDEEMYRFAVSENVQRRDLDAIEIAKAMTVYRDQFGKNSDEIGALFGMNGATVRGKMRLLDLPESIANKLSSGEISEGSARTIVSLQKMATEEELLDAIKEAGENPDENPTYVITRCVAGNSNVVSMWDDSDRGKPRSKRWGNSWLLDMKKFPNDLLPALTYADVIKALNIEEQPRLKKLSEKTSSFYELLDKLKENNDPDAGKIEHLLDPTACTACPFYTKLEGTHYCGMRVCYDRKMAAWKTHQFVQMSKSTDIAIYKLEDGKFRLLDHYNEKVLFSKKNKDLRLLPKDQFGGHQYQSFDGIDSDIAWLVITGETLKKRDEEKKKAKAEGKPETEGMDADAIVENILENADHTLRWYAAQEVKKTLFEGWTAEAIEFLYAAPYGWRKTELIEPLKTPDEDAKNLLIIARAMVDQGDDEEYDPMDITSAAQIVEGLAKTCKSLGVKPPKSLTKMAEEFDAQIAAARVATETEKPKKKK